MTKMPVEKLILILGLPSTVSVMITHIYNLVDTYFVGKIGTSASGAIGIIFGLMAVIQAFGFMFGQGSGNIISRMLGAKQDNEANIVASTAIISSFSVGLIITILGISNINPLLFLLGSTDTIYPYAEKYAFWILIASPFTMCSLAINNLFRYQGKAYLGMIAMCSGAFLNMILDPILIFSFDMGITGAGLSTAISQIISFSIIFTLFSSRYCQLSFSFPGIKRIIQLNGDICITGLPAMFRQGLGSISTMLLNRGARMFGDAAVASMSIVGRVTFLAFATGLGIAQGYQPVAGYNYGSGNYKRVMKGFLFTIIMSEIILVMFACIALTYTSEIISIFRDDENVIEIGEIALKYASVGVVFLPVTVCTNIVYQSIGENRIASILAIMRSGAFFIPYILVLPKVFGMFGVMISQPCADITAALTTIPFAVIIYRKLGEKFSESEVECN